MLRCEERSDEPRSTHRGWAPLSAAVRPSRLPRVKPGVAPQDEDRCFEASGERVDHAVNEVRLVERGGVDEAAAADLADGLDHLAQGGLLLPPQRLGLRLRHGRETDRAAGAAAAE